jgi:SAM-dependent methyltransferase
MGRRQVKTTPYLALADVYDDIYSFQRIEPWLDRVWIFLKKMGITSGKQLDIGSGTCSSANFWMSKGFELFCLDVSFPMLSNAKVRNKDLGCHYICGSYECLKRIPSFSIVTAIDTVANYIAFRDGALLSFFEAVYSTLNKGGVFVFDVMTPIVKNWLPDYESISINPDREINIRRRIDVHGHYHKLTSVVYINDKYRKNVEKHELTLLRPGDIKLVLEYAGFEGIYIGDIMMSGIEIAELPSFDVFAIKGCYNS